MLPRVLTALVGTPILLILVWWGGLALAVLVILAAALSIREFYRLLPPETGPLPIALGMIWTTALVVGASTASGALNFLIVSGGIWVSGVFVALLWMIAFHSARRRLTAVIYLLGGPIYIGFLLGHSLALRDLDGGGSLGRDWLLFAVLVTFATDSGAYFTGRLLGRRPLAPNVSPGKTWEGSAGGFVFAVAAALVLGAIFDLSIALWQVGVVGATVGVASQWGDLLDSKLKRIAGVKDAGNLFPGHGGILDRLDSIVISVPAVYYLVATVFTP